MREWVQVARDSRFPQPQLTVGTECGEEVLVRVVSESYNILLVGLWGERRGEERGEGRGGLLGYLAIVRDFE